MCWKATFLEELIWEYKQTKIDFLRLRISSTSRHIQGESELSVEL